MTGPEPTATSDDVGVSTQPRERPVRCRLCGPRVLTLAPSAVCGVHRLTAEPTCPGCGQPPALSFTAQAFCGNDNCHVFTWNPTLSLADNLANSSTIELPPFLSPPRTSEGTD